MISGYRPVSMGIVTEDKPEGSEIIKVTPYEVLYDQSAGKINEIEKQELGNLPSIESGDFHSEHKSTSIVRARWLPMGGSNRMTPPDICRNEKVMLYKYGNSEEWYWTEMGRSPGMRGKENVIYSWSNKKIGGVKEEADESNSVVMQVNTIEGHVLLTTPQNDGEECTYEVRVDYKNSKVLIKDNIGNSIELDSPSGSLDVTTNETVTINTKKFTVNAEESQFNVDQHEVNAHNKVNHNTPIVSNSEDMTTGGDNRIGGSDYVSGVTHTGGIDAGGGGGSGTAVIRGDLHVHGTAHGRYPR